MSAPIVAALVGLIRSVNPALGVQDVYRIVTRSAVKVDQVDYPDSFFGTDPTTGEAVSWSRKTGFGRIDAYEALKYTLEHYGGTIGGAGVTIVFHDDITVQPGAVLEVLPGTTLQLASGVDLKFRSPTAWAGTATQPIRIERLDPGQPWGSVTLLADGNTLEHVVLDGGTKNIDVASRNNTLRNVTSRNGWRNLSSGAPYSGTGRSTVEVYSSTFEEATSVGVVVANTNLTMYRTTIQNSAQAGLWVSYGGVTPTESAIIGNGAAANRDGVELYSGAALYAEDYALTRVQGNGRHEVWTSGSALAYLAVGHNSICDAGDPGVTGKYVYEGGSYDVSAYGNWWGTASPSPTMFTGNVTYSPGDAYPFISGGCASSAGGGSARSGPALASLSLGAPAEGEGGDGAPNARRGRDPEALRAWIREARAALTARAATADGPALAAELYRLQRADADDALGEAAATMAVYEGLRKTPGAERQGPLRAVAERAALVALDDALLRSDTGRARALLDEHADQVTSELGRVELAAARVEVLRREGRYDDALAHLRASAEILGEGYVSVVEADLALLAGGETGGGGAAARGPNPPASAIAGALDPPSGLEVEPPFPNPAAHDVTVPVVLDRVAEVDVALYDALGRRVAYVVVPDAGPGRHTVRLDASGLPAGVYVVRTAVRVGAGPDRVVVHRLTVVR